MRFSPSNLGWYPESIEYKNLPDDCITVSDALWQSLLGKPVAVGPDGVPYERLSTPIDPRAALKSAVTAKRWDVETGGITLPNGVQVSTGTADQNRIASVIATAELGGVKSVEFKATSGWATLTIAELRGIAAAIALHVQACFAAERKHHGAIDAASDAALASYDVNAGWPA